MIQEEALLAEQSEFVKQRRSAWARMIKKIYGVDPHTCPQCSSPLKLIATIHDPEVIEKIVRHVGKWVTGRGRDPPGGSATGSTPGERRIVIDEYAQEFPPDEDPPAPEYEWRA